MGQLEALSDREHMNVNRRSLDLGMVGQHHVQDWIQIPLYDIGGKRGKCQNSQTFIPRICEAIRVPNELMGLSLFLALSALCQQTSWRKCSNVHLFGPIVLLGLGCLDDA
jgi:hypothetical protein